MNDNNYSADTYVKEKNDKKTVRRILTVVIAFVIAAASFTIGFFTRKLTQREELSSLEWVLSTIKNNYYFYEDFDGGEAKNLSLKAIASQLDIYSEYYTAEEYAMQTLDNSGEKSGIGIRYGFVEGKGVYITSVVGNSPANASGLVAGDIIVSGTAGGETTKFLSSSDFISFINERAEGETFVLGGEDCSYTLSKEIYNASYTYMATAETAWEFVSSGDNTGFALVENRDKAINFLPDGFAYINISQFYGTAGSEFGALVKKFNAEHCTSLIIDLRNNGGGYVSVMQDIGGYFTSSVTDNTCVAMTAEYRNGKREVFDCVKHKNNGISRDVSVYVMTNSGTASASEALIGVLVSYDFLKYENIFISDYSKYYLDWAGAGAKTKQTYGKGIMQSSFVNPLTGEALKLTTAQIYWPNGKCIHGVALSQKDGCTLVPADWTVTKDDGEMKEAIKIINQRK